ncbi:MAG: dTDP-4-dehydrorhamnose reductase [Bacteroidales bacterium]|jgi:dTDP-4-dehydrorhamnose reductase
MAVILVTGANGQLGSELKALSKKFYGYQFIFTDIDTLDITDKEDVRAFIKNSDPDWIINCAAYNLVDRAEDEKEKAMLINKTAVSNIAESITGSDRRFIHISTDYVFDGRSNVPYNESSPAVPLGAYGESKLAGEKAALLHYGSMVIRTSWLYSSFGTNFVKTIIAGAEKNDFLKVVFDQVGTPTYAGDLANAIMTIISGVVRNHVTFNPGIFHYSNEGVCSRYDYAFEIVRKAGIECRVVPVLSKDFASKAVRPAYSVLDKSRIKECYNVEVPYWRESLAKCIRLILT